MMTLLGSALMGFAALTWLRGYQRLSEDSDLAELTLACVLINVAAFDVWLLSLGSIAAIKLWAAHALAAGLLTLFHLGIKAPQPAHPLRRSAMTQTGMYAVLAVATAAATFG
jgi:hypothetical protein